MNNSFNTRKTLSVGDDSYEIFSLRKLSETHDMIIQASRRIHE